MRVYNLIEDGQ